MTPATRSRQSAGLSVAEAAQRLHVTPAYIRQAEREGAPSYRFARRLARLYGVPITTFAKRRQKRTAETTARPAGPKTGAGLPSTSAKMPHANDGQAGEKEP